MFTIKLSYKNRKMVVCKDIIDRAIFLGTSDTISRISMSNLNTTILSKPLLKVRVK